jgi:hypothetical protein
LNIKKQTIAIIMSAPVICTGCGYIYDYELERIAKLCNGHENIKRLWTDAGNVKAICSDGNSVDVRD